MKRFDPEFHVRRAARDQHALPDAMFSLRGDLIVADMSHVYRMAAALQRPDLRPSDIFAMGLLHEILHAVIARYRRAHMAAWSRFEDGADDVALSHFVGEFPPTPVYQGKTTGRAFLQTSHGGRLGRSWMAEEALLVWVANENPAYRALDSFISDAALRRDAGYVRLVTNARGTLQVSGGLPGGPTLLDLLEAPARAAPDSIWGQLAYVRETWGDLVAELGFADVLVRALDFRREDDRWFLRRAPAPTGQEPPPRYVPETAEAERFSEDAAWMPRVVLLAKSTFVWLDQLRAQYGRDIRTLADIPDEELAKIQRWGVTGLWLIGVWRRSRASGEMKRRMGNPDALASAYSLDDYAIAEELGGEAALHALRDRAARYGIRLASDMVPNHMGIDSRWVIEHPDWFVQTREPPFPGYRFSGDDLSHDDRVALRIEDGYWSRTDAAVVFQRVDRRTGDTRYVYHGNDGTSMPWNDTAQLDYLHADVREAVMQTILHVARSFPIIRFDAAMTLAKRHYQRLWYPEPGSGGDIPSRARFGMSKQEFDACMPEEFWREVVERVAKEVPDTLLLAEAFWLMEGYFVRTLGMHRVYNSAFMNMLKREENANYRRVIKDVLAFQPEILGRFVNFMNNPDEEPAIVQFGEGDKYFAVCTLMCTMPGLPMLGHGQIEGLWEKYGMEFSRAAWQEKPNVALVARHEREIFPLLRKRHVFSGVRHFRLFDLVTDDGHVNEDVFAYANRSGEERALVVVHNRYADTRGWLRPYDQGQNACAEGLGAALSVDPEKWVIFRDVVSGLEYIRHGRELREAGLYIDLSAFGRHVFMDFREVESMQERPYAELAVELRGQGVPYLERQMDDFLSARRVARREAEWKTWLDSRAYESPLAPQTARAVHLLWPEDAMARWVRLWLILELLESHGDDELRAAACAWTQWGSSPEEAWHAVNVARWRARRTPSVLDAGATRSLQRDVLAILDSEEEARLLLGHHQGEQGAFVVQERFESAVRWLSAAHEMQRHLAAKDPSRGAPGDATAMRTLRDGLDAAQVGDDRVGISPAHPDDDAWAKESAQAAGALFALAARAGYRTGFIVARLRELLG